MPQAKPMNLKGGPENQKPIPTKAAVEQAWADQVEAELAAENACIIASVQTLSETNSSTQGEKSPTKYKDLPEGKLLKLQPTKVVHMLASMSLVGFNPNHEYIINLCSSKPEASRVMRLTGSSKGKTKETSPPAAGPQRPPWRPARLNRPHHRFVGTPTLTSKGKEREGKKIANPQGVKNSLTKYLQI